MITIEFAFLSLTSILFCFNKNTGDSGRNPNKMANITIIPMTNFGIA